MKTYREIADEYDVRLKDVQAASAMVEKIAIPYQVIRDDPDTGCQYTDVNHHIVWFVNSDAGVYSHAMDRLELAAYSTGDTRWEAVENAIAKGYRADQHNW